MKRNPNLFRFLAGVLVLNLLVGCGNSGSLELTELHPFVNLAPTGGDTLFLQMELSNAVTQGIELPGNRAAEPVFRFEAKVRNGLDQPQKLFYKLYYQNESYKFRENQRVWAMDSAGNPYWVWPQNADAAQNFYGSWQDASEGFRPLAQTVGAGEWVTLSDTFRIVGNPRDEKRYYGPGPDEAFLTPDEMERTLAAIKRNKDWVAALHKKAAENKVPYEEQLYLDAIWAVNHKRQTGDFNNRWKRNPRTGNYRFMLVVATESALAELPKGVQQIGTATQDPGGFLNPFYYFLHAGKDLPSGVAVIKSSHVVNAKASMDMASGIYVDNVLFRNHLIPDSCRSLICGDSREMYQKAHFAQYFHTTYENLLLENVPISRDVTGSGMTRSEFAQLQETYSNPATRVRDYVRITDCPCKSVGYDPAQNAILLENPTHQAGKRVKENVGIHSRIGFTYGKFRALIEFPEMLSEDHVWNGLTNAFWLIFQGDGAWNLRDSCHQSGYIPKGSPENDASRQPQISYSEIDIEIVKTSKYWPQSSYGGIEDYPREDPSLNRDLTVTFTNWDMACGEPKRFHSGVLPYVYQGQSYEYHRWDRFYRAITAKVPRAHDLTVGKPIWYEIEWKPEAIIWRIGEDKEHMEVFGYMDKSVTKIPDNQMVAVVTQEWHHDEWWPLTPFKQDGIPFPEKPIRGKVLAMEIE